MTHPKEAVEAVARALSASASPDAWGYWTDSATALLDQIAPMLAARAEAEAREAALQYLSDTGQLMDRIAALEADTAAAVATEREACAECVKMMLEDEGISLQQISDTYRDAMVSGIHNGRKMPKDAAKSFARHFAERSDAVYQMGDHAAAAIRALSPPSAAARGQEVEALVQAARQMRDDYQTSDTHHPDHVLVPLSWFEAMRAALAQITGGKA